MSLLQIIKDLEGKSNAERMIEITRHLQSSKIPYKLLKYPSGTNLVVEFPGRQKLGISCHFDVVKNSPGANDNGSAIAVALTLIKTLYTSRPKNFGMKFFFFDEEENGLRGSKAYIKEHGVKDLFGLINLEMVGMGDQLALWTLNENSKGIVMETLEKEAENMQVSTQRYDRVVTHFADHLPFQRGGLEDAFSVTCISEKDKEVAYHYYKAQEFDVDKEVLFEILADAPIFANYHKPTDKSEFLREESLELALGVVHQTITALDQIFLQEKK